MLEDAGHMSATSAAETPGMIAAMIVGVLAFSTALAWGMWRMFRRVERAERDPRYLRRLLMRGALLYACAALLGITLVATGSEPKESLVGLPIAALFIWTYFRAAMRVKVPPD